MKKEKVDKLTDQAFARLIITSVLAIVFCLFCLCSTTWAWFSESQASASNSIKSANCLLNITVEREDAENIVVDFEGGEKDVILKQGIQHSVKLEIPADSASGYCVITIKDGDSDESNDIKIYTQAVSYNGAPYTDTLSFKLISDENVEVSITPCWGIYSGDVHIFEGDTVRVSSVGFVSEVQAESESESVDNIGE